LGSAIPAIPAFESLRVITADTSKAVDREPVRIVQTPQVFRSSILVTAFQQDFKDTFTDEATVVEATGARVYLAPGEKSNIKITEPEDMVIAEALINANTMA
jgi:2-C-methyl-D-erythritol 4-phosphate cytidylyltransferase